MTARQEWARLWPLPIVAMIGTTGGPTFSYAAGVLAEPVSKDLGWTRTEFYSALTLQLMAAILIIPLVGFLIDRIGSRRVALIGCFTHMVGLSLYGLADGSLWQWWAFCLFSLLAGAFITQPVWVRPVAAGFRNGRGLALAIALSGNGVATSIWPMIAAHWVETVGWRLTFPALALCWGVVTIPLALFFFHDQKAAGTDASSTIAPAKESDRPAVGPVLRSSSFILLTLSGALLSCAVFGLTVHFVPLLRSKGLDLATAASIAGTVGLFSIAGRIGTGALLDRFSTAVVGMTVFLVPVSVALLLWLGGSSLPCLILAGALLGLTAGAEIDIITFVASRQFDNRIFGSIYATAISVFSFIASLGPLVASSLYDLSRSYDGFLAVTAILSVCATLMLGRVVLHRAPGTPDLVPARIGD